MSKGKMLRVLPRGTAMVPHYDSQAAGRRAFHGWKHDATKGPDYIDPISKTPRKHGAFVRSSEVVDIPMTSEFAAEYIRHLRDRDLWPADAETAQMAGVKFDPNFGDDHRAEPEATPEPAPAAAEH